MHDKSREQLIDEIAALRTQLATLQADQQCWDKDAESAPCVAQKRLAGILTIADDAIISADASQRITLFNQGAERIFGYQADEVLGQPIHVLLPERYQARHVGLVETFSKGTESARVMGIRSEVVGRRKNGEEFPAEASISRLEVGVGTVLTVILRDITERKRSEAALSQARDQALEASRIKSAFLANMSHEIRTPMNGVIGMISLLLETELSDAQREYATIIHDSAQSLMTIIDDILDYSKIEAGKLQLEIIDFAPLTLVEGVAELLATKAKAKGLSLMTYVDPELPATLRGDPVRLRQILLNLGDNAVKFTATGEVVIKATLAGREKSNVVVDFSVRDTGIGLSEDVRGALFEPFVQADGSTTRRFGGTGLGLSISRRLVDRMGGQIGVDSAPGEGALFWFRVPLECEPERSVPVIRMPDLRGVRVLVVDDNETAREILKRYLDSWSVVNDTAESGEEGLRMLRAAAAHGQPYDIAIIDLRMPTSDGIQLAMWVQAEEALRDTRLILLTAFDAHGQGEEALRLGFSAYMTKPVKQSHLFDCLVSLLEKEGQINVRSGENASTAKYVPQGTVRRSKTRVLVAEDNLVNQKVVLLQLERLGYPADAVANGIEAVKAVASGEYDLVLMDCQMPEMDGFRATETIRKAELTTGRRIPIIALTANAMLGDRERCIGAGMDDYISKPVSPNELQAALERWQSPNVTPTDDKGKAGESREAVTQPALQPSETPQLMDVDALFATYGPGKERVCKLLELFARSTPPLLQRIEDGIEERSVEESQAAAHELKGAANMIGAHELGECSLKVEEAVRKEDWSAADAAVRRLLETQRRTDALIRTLIQDI